MREVYAAFNDVALASDTANAFNLEVSLGGLAEICAMATHRDDT